MWFPTFTPHPWFATTTPVATPAHDSTVTPTPTATPTQQNWRLDIVLEQAPGSDNLGDYGSSLGSYYFNDLSDIDVHGRYWISAPSGSEGGFRVSANLYWMGSGVTPTVRLTVTVGTGPYEAENFRCFITGAGSAIYLSPGHVSGEMGPRVYWEWRYDVCPNFPFVVYSYHYQSSKSFWTDSSPVLAKLEYYANSMRHSGWFRFMVSDVSYEKPVATPTPSQELTPTPTSVPAVTPTPGGCWDLDPGDNVEVVPVPRVAPGVCASVGPFDFSLPLVGRISVPLVKICLVPIWFGSIDLFGVRVSLDLVFAAAAGAMILRWLWRS
jgi:hypothetical protein